MNKIVHLHYFLLTACCCFLLFTTSATAQNYKWVKGGGSVDPMSPSAFWEHVTDICTDDNRNVYILSPVGDDDITADTFNMPTSFFYGGSGSSTHQFVASYSCNGTMRWAKLLDAYHGASASFFKAIAYSDGSIYITATLVSDSNYLDPMASYKYFGYDTIVHNIYQSAFIVRYDTSGKLKWIRFIGQGDTYDWEGHNPIPTAMAVDGKGNIHDYIVVDSGIVIDPTFTTNQKGNYDLTYDTSGNLLNAVRMQIDSNWEIKTIVINKTSNIAYTVITYVPGGYYQDYISAYSPTGSQLWATDSTTVINGLAYDQKGHIYSAGLGYRASFTLNGVTVPRDKIDTAMVAVLFSMDTLGHVKKTFPFYAGIIGAFSSVAIVNDHAIAATGDLIGTFKYGNDSIITSSGSNPVMVVVDTTGRLIKLDWLHSGGSNDWGSAITSDNVGDVYIGGQIESSVHAGAFSYISHGGNTDYFVAKYGYNCNCTLATEPLSNFTYTGNGTVSFSYTGSSAPDSVKWDFGDGGSSSSLNPTHTFSDTGTHTVCLTVYACDSGTYCSSIHNNLSVNKIASLPQVSIYPNPFNDQLFIEHAGTGMHVTLYNIVGQQVYSGSITQEKQLINTATLKPGSYILQLSNPDGRRMSMTVVKQ